MAERMSVARLREDQIEAAADLMNLVFFEQLRVASRPPSAEQQLAYREGYLRVAKYWCAHGEPLVATVGTEIAGIALWMPPNTLDRDEEERREFGTDQLESIFRDSLSHLFPLTQLLGKLRREQMSNQPHWFMPSRLDVSPAHYGKGVATALLRPVLERCDEGQVACYIETILDFMVPFFRKHRFEVLSEGVEPIRGVRYWTMRRDPQTI
jgi:GNAT superfamily N-acetyltransferase